jgi:NAD(P)-dependent dehydrogenase (short-subunit alcohol dehydrogenase family)
MNIEKKRILITGATDGIGLQTARALVESGHHVLIHGRSADKLQDLATQLAALPGDGQVQSYQADFSRLDDVARMAKEVAAEHTALDVLINNAGVLKTPSPVTADGFDVRFVVNTFAPWLLTQALLPLFNAAGRIINLSSAAQASVDLEALAGNKTLSDMEAYAQSKLALTMYSAQLAAALGDAGPVVVAINPGSLLATKMVRDGFGVDGKDVGIGADILIRAALSDEFASASGAYFDNDIGQFGQPHRDALDAAVSQRVNSSIETLLGAHA